MPPVRAALMPLTRAERAILAVAAVLLNPLLWALALVSLVWAGAAAFVAFVLLATSMQVLVGLARLVAGRRRRGRSTPSARVTLGGFRGLVVIRLREIGTTLDLWSAVFFAIAGVSYQLLARSPDAAARPVLALLIALTLSTLAQRTFALTGPAGVTRYRLLPLSGWRILLAYDAALLLVTVTLVAPFRLRAGLAAMLAAMAAGRWAAVRQQGWQRRWRFCGGDIRFGVAQVILGTLAGAGANAISNWFIVGAAALYLASLALGDRWWRQPRPG